ncbi:RICIN domain-containing protein [Sphaerisporangium fuscum]|uniref:RICIN domain-containing protein n=1 Tax=Sphaerisporangium fuscum TaxID=2835868 RepID=UPI001BDCDFEE|nr:ricin-type beta-trefoil lectin domain protein [Sphaerisporangium fuscum]
MSKVIPRGLFSLLLAVTAMLTGLDLAAPRVADAAAQAPTTAGAPGFACDAKDSPDKGWVLPIYVYQPGQDASDSEIDEVLRAMWQTDQTFDMSAHRFGVSRRLRILQDDQCRPVVAKLPFTKGRNRAEMDQALKENLASQPERVRELWPTKRVKPLYFVRDNDITNSCTGGGADAGISNGGVILPRWCWGEAGLTHEMLHTFGLSHCNQAGGGGPNGNDPLCRNWGKRPECTRDAASNYHLDSCRTDDFRYFEPTPQSQPRPEPLAKNRNVAFSPYLITDQPSPELDFRLRVEKSDKCVDGSGQEVVRRECSSGRTQIWRRSIDGDGYLTIRNLGTGKCLTMSTTPDQKTAPVVTSPCKTGEASQQWLPQEDAVHTNFINRTGGMSQAALAVEGQQTNDAAPLVRGGGSAFVAESVKGQQTSEPTSPTSPAPRDAQIKSVYGSCLTGARGVVRLGSCTARWRIVPVSGQTVRLQLNGRCMALGPARRGGSSLGPVSSGVYSIGPSGREGYSVVLARCSRQGKGQLWELESQSDGTVTLKSAPSAASRGRLARGYQQVVVYAGDPVKKIPVYAGAPRTDKTLRFTIT